MPAGHPHSGPTAAPDDSRARDLTLLYQENVKITAIFLDWRHKVMTRWFAVIGAAFVSAAWFYQRDELRPWLGAPLLLAGLFSIMSALLDQRNLNILQRCYSIGGDIELQLGREAIFKFLGDSHLKGITYTKVLRVTYYGVAVLLFILSICAFVFLRQPLPAKPLH